jgi:hypothetical protein
MAKRAPGPRSRRTKSIRRTFYRSCCGEKPRLSFAVAGIVLNYSEGANQMMQRDRTILSEVVPRLLALAIALVVGLPVGPELSTHPASPPVACSVDQKISGDAYKVGERLEPRVFPAPLVDRLPPVSRLCGPAAVGGASEAVAPGVVASDSRSHGDPLPIVKHVPRMERGDPPRI